jgi:hypothetical protein
MMVVTTGEKAGEELVTLLGSESLRFACDFPRFVYSLDQANAG